MICPPCKTAAAAGQPHYGCANAAGAGTDWCDCQHEPGTVLAGPPDRVPAPAQPCPAGTGAHHPATER